MTYIPLYPYHSDPLHILGRRQHNRPSEPVAESSDPPPPEEAPEPPPAPDDAPDKGMPCVPADPPSRSEQEAESVRVVREWLGEHWNAVEALARAGEAPLRADPEPVVRQAHHERENSSPTSVRPEAVEGPPEPPYVAPGDRWTKWKMAEFLRQLAATHSVTAAAKAVGMSRVSAYKLRTRLKGQPFDVAWEAAFRHGYDDLAHAALELALEGEEVPHYYQGELVATHRRRNPQLIVQLLRMRNSVGVPMLGRYGAAAEFWSERWEQMTQRVETGSVTWNDERKTLGLQALEQIEGPDAEREIDLIIKRNLPDEPKGPFGRKV